MSVTRMWTGLKNCHGRLLAVLLSLKIHLVLISASATASYSKGLGPDEKGRSPVFTSRACALVYRGLRLRRSRAWVLREVTL